MSRTAKSSERMVFSNSVGLKLELDHLVPESANRIYIGMWNQRINHNVGGSAECRVLPAAEASGRQAY